MAAAPEDRLEDEVPDAMVASFFSSHSEMSSVPPLFDERVNPSKQDLLPNTAAAPEDRLEDEVPDAMVASFFSSHSEMSSVPPLFDERVNPSKHDLLPNTAAAPEDRLEDEDEVPDAMVSSFFSSESEMSSVPSRFEERAAEDKVAEYHPRDNDDRTKQVLSSFLRFLPPEGKEMLAEFIAMAADDKTLYSLYRHLLTCILIPMKARTITPAITPSPFEDNQDTVEPIAASMHKSPSRRSQSQLKELCLRRDGFRCMATGVIDTSVEEIGTSESGPTELAHILPFSIGRWDNNPQNHKVAQIWATLTKCFPSINLGPTDINHPTNLMTLLSLVHKAFGEFTLAFEPTSNDDTNEYRILTFGRRYPTVLNLLLPQPNKDGDRIVRFEQHADVELPSRVLLQTHAALSRILHASGMAEYIDKIMEDREEIGCLASDGSTNIQKLLFVF